MWFAPLAPAKASHQGSIRSLCASAHRSLARTATPVPTQQLLASLAIQPREMGHTAPGVWRAR